MCIVTDVICSVVLSVVYTSETCKNGWTDPSCLGLTQVDPGNHVWGRDPSTLWGNLWWLCGPLKSIGCLCYSVYTAEGIIQSSLVAQHMLRPFIKIVRPLFTLYVV